MTKRKTVVPIVKWVGGKRQLLSDITPLLPKRISLFCEPFLGGGAVFFSLQPRRAIVNDINADLISVYEVVRDDVENLIESLRGHKNTDEYFYELRAIDRDEKAYAKLSKVEKASRFIYLNKTCYNGLFRVNSRGEFNAPYGRYANPNIVNEKSLRSVSKYIQRNEVTFISGDFAKVLDNIPKGTFVYLDPPYDPISETSNFTDYSKLGFSREEQVRLKECCDELTERGIRFMLSNSATDFICDLYKDYDTVFVKALRSINSNGKKRGAIDEVIVRNYTTCRGAR